MQGQHRFTDMLYQLLKEVPQGGVFMDRGLKIIQPGTEVDQQFDFCFLLS
jgi:hypothetical protein